MIVQQTNAFKRKVKKLHKKEKLALDDAVKTVITDPSIGENKKGDLKGIQVFKYQFNSQLYLLAYSFIEEELILTFVEHGPHENFYRNVKNIEFKGIN